MTKGERKKKSPGDGGEVVCGVRVGELTDGELDSLLSAVIAEQNRRLDIRLDGLEDLEVGGLDFDVGEVGGLEGLE